MTGFDAGKSFEHYVFLELIAYKYLNNKRDELFYWCTKDPMEVESNITLLITLSLWTDISL
ncbi:hypothetical protein [Rickettsia rickettsii]|uniref:hypothetical protein n=1 Tax=Rickettsia rickettsii TaxID=783 RepID=UPI00024F9872|nr:hypothetical protein [Rickettsia rickettsii]AFB22066.1 hypothetical protein RPN_02710 [Rickettsia rickettsii str. Brazil]USD86242.1 DUF4143 domain-containing protein [Rickettsia rickettsii]USD87557.1 DUF4143 domain-containing protein [Rickettsia rickettsii]